MNHCLRLTWLDLTWWMSEAVSQENRRTTGRDLWWAKVWRVHIVHLRGPRSPCRCPHSLAVVAEISQSNSAVSRSTARSRETVVRRQHGVAVARSDDVVEIQPEQSQRSQKRPEQRRNGQNDAESAKRPQNLVTRLTWLAWCITRRTLLTRTITRSKSNSQSTKFRPNTHTQ